MRLLTDSRRGAVRHDSATGEWQPATMYIAWFDAGRPEASGRTPSPWESWEHASLDEEEVLRDLQGLGIDVFASWESESDAADVARRAARAALERALVHNARARAHLLALQAKLEAT